MPKKSNDKTNSNIETNFNKITKVEIDSIISSITMQNYIRDTILSLSDTLWDKLSSSSNVDSMHDIGKTLYDISNFSLQLQNNINSLENFKIKLETLYSSTNTIELEKTFTTKTKKYHDELKSYINKAIEFNSSFNGFITKISEINFSSICIQDNISNNTKNNISIDEVTEETTNYSKEKTKKVKKLKTPEISCIPDNLKENTLIISNTEVILPFTEDELDDKLISSNLTSYQDVVDTFYKKSVKSFEPSIISRFKEGYSLIINKEHGSKLKAITLALELSTNYNLHPAIIAACKNLTQLDVYLSCLEYNELSDFHFFDIIYNIPPAPKKQIFKKTIKDT